MSAARQSWVAGKARPEPRQLRQLRQQTTHWHEMRALPLGKRCLPSCVVSRESGGCLLPVSAQTPCSPRAPVPKRAQRERARRPKHFGTFQERAVFVFGIVLLALLLPSLARGSVSQREHAVPSSAIHKPQTLPESSQLLPLTSFDGQRLILHHAA